MRRKAIIFTEDNKNLLNLSAYLVQDDWDLLSGGETAEFLEKNEISVTDTPSLLNTSKDYDDFAAILKSIMNTRLQNDENFHTSDNDSTITPLVCVNIIPKYENLNSEHEFSSIANKIDKNHISLIRAAAKNYTNVLILTDPEDYQEAIIQLKTNKILKDFRLYLAAKALNLTAAYDAGLSLSIPQNFKKMNFPDYFVFPYKKSRNLTQGANEHQEACLYTLHGTQSIISGIKKIQGEEVDFGIIKNNVAAWNVVTLFLNLLKNPFEVPSTDSLGYSYSTQFTPATSNVFTIGVKFCIPVGAAFGPDVTTSFLKTASCNPEALDKATIGCSAVIDEKTAAEIVKINVSAIIAPDFTNEARKILSEKKSIRLMVASNPVASLFESNSIGGGFLTQIPDSILFKQWSTVTKKRPSQQQIDAMALGTIINIATKSNSVIIINDSTTIGISSGQPNQSKALSAAIDSAQECLKNNLTSSDTNAEVLVSDDSIPFGDFIYRLPEIGVKAIIQPGGASTDNELIEYCNEHEISMIFTKMTHLNF